MEMQVISWADFIAFGHIPRSGTVGSQDTSNVSFLRPSHAVFHTDCTHSALPPSVHYNLLFSTFSPPCTIF